MYSELPVSSKNWDMAGACQAMTEIANTRTTIMATVVFGEGKAVFFAGVPCFVGEYAVICFSVNNIRSWNLKMYAPACCGLVGIQKHVVLAVDLGNSEGEVSEAVAVGLIMVVDLLLFTPAKPMRHWRGCEA